MIVKRYQKWGQDAKNTFSNDFVQNVHDPHPSSFCGAVFRLKPVSFVA